jgi:chorismate dehydratase
VVGRDEPALSEAERVGPANIHQSLRIGCVKYLNARPLIRGWTGEVTLDHPAALCAQLARGDLDVALVSSFEFLRNPIYRVVDDISISSAGPVYSVVVAYTGKAPPPEIELDPASLTSVAMLQYLIIERGRSFKPVEMAGDVLSPPNEGRARLLIGDQAIRFRQKFGDAYRYWDLGEEWKGLAKLPFVYALWLIRPEVVYAKVIADQLRALRNKNLAEIDKLIAEEKEFDCIFCARYYREHVQFSFGEKEKEGLRAFQRLCEKHGLLPKRNIAFTVV